MRALRMPEAVLAEIRTHAREAYPNECCGFLIAAPDPSLSDSARRVLEARRAANEVEGDARRRFVIRAEDLRTVERWAEETGKSVVGFYHSHPDHPARPSAFDTSHAWPWYTYVVLSVTDSDTPGVGAFELDADAGVFQDVALTVEPPTGATDTENLRAPEAR
jgi:proteasome lid subunit RPN8/RPN11